MAQSLKDCKSRQQVIDYFARGYAGAEPAAIFLADDVEGQRLSAIIDSRKVYGRQLQAAWEHCKGDPDVFRDAVRTQQQAMFEFAKQGYMAMQSASTDMVSFP